jgi:hypothetical protein
MKKIAVEIELLAIRVGKGCIFEAWSQQVWLDQI